MYKINHINESVTQQNVHEISKIDKKDSRRTEEESEKLLQLSRKARRRFLRRPAWYSAIGKIWLGWYMLAPFIKTNKRHKCPCGSSKIYRYCCKKTVDSRVAMLNRWLMSYGYRPIK